MPNLEAILEPVTMYGLENHIAKQVELNTSKNLLYPHITNWIEIDPNFIATVNNLLHNTAKTQTLPQNVVSLAVQTLIDKLYAINQYININHDAIQELEKIYEQTWQIILKTTNVEETLRTYHYPALSQWLLPLYPAELRQQLQDSPHIGRVVCEEYSASFQLELFNITADQLREPIIDIGCGRHASLVHHLQSQQIDAFGIDRIIDNKDSTYLEQADWFDVTFQPRSWGTIISNMAFTNHLTYVYHHDKVQLERYLLKLYELLQALVVGGCFYYAPGIRFIEEQLNPAQYTAARRSITETIAICQVTRVA